MSARLRNSYTCEMGHHAPCSQLTNKTSESHSITKVFKCLGLTFFYQKHCPQKIQETLEKSSFSEKSYNLKTLQKDLQ